MGIGFLLFWAHLAFSAPADLAPVPCNDEPLASPSSAHSLQKIGEQLRQTLWPSGHSYECQQVTWELEQQIRHFKVVGEKGYPINQSAEDDWMAAKEKDFEKIPSRTGTPAPEFGREETCRLYRDLTLAMAISHDYTQYEKSVRAGLDELVAGLENLGQEIQLLQQADSAGAFVECVMDAKSELDEAGKICAAKMKFSSAQVVLGLIKRKYQTPERLACLLSKEQRKAVTSSLAEAQAVPPKAHAAIEKTAASFGDRARVIFKFYQRLQPKFEKIKKMDQANAFGCEAQFKEERESAKKKLRVLHYEDDIGSSTGTGFYVRTSDSTAEFITAEHVAFSEDLARKSIEVKVTDHKQEAVEHDKFSFHKIPGSYDLSNDAVKSAAALGPDALTAVEEGKLPALGQEFELLGLPPRLGVLSGMAPTYTRRRCVFAGIDQGLRNEATYAFYCPTLNTSHKGASGGAVVDDEGKVWGIISAGIATEKVIAATPLSQSKDGSLKFGFQHSFHFSHCLSAAKISEARPCQVIPGLTFEKSVP